MTKFTDFVDWHERSFFEAREDHYFLVNILAHILYVSKPTIEQGQYWFKTPVAHFKATTVKCCSLTELEGLKVHLKDHPLVKGRIGGWGVSETKFPYVFWYQMPIKEPNAYALPHIETLVIEN